MQSISVIIAAYNEQQHIENCLTTLMNQSQTLDELIVVGDGSTDKTWTILQSCKRIFPKLKIFRKEHLEQATARNFGFTKSTGEILVFPDADYYFDRHFLEKLVAPIFRGEVIATYTNEEYVANPENIWTLCWNTNASLPQGRRVPSNNPVRSNNFRSLLRREFEKAGGFSETGYSNDITVLNKLGVKDAGLAAKGAICYHYNPDTLAKVFTAAFRKGRKGGITLTLRSFLIYSPPNCFRKGLTDGLKYHKPHYLLFKLIFDLGVTLGMIERLF